MKLHKCISCKKYRHNFIDGECLKCYGNTLFCKVKSTVYSCSDVYDLSLFAKNEVINRRHHIFNDCLSSPEASYFAGLIAADGNLKSDTPVVSLKLVDFPLMQRFSRFIGKLDSIPTYYYGRENTPIYTVSVYSREMYNSLLNLNIVPNKGNRNFAYPENLVMDRHFIRGVLDGDGTISRDENRVIIYGTQNLVKGIGNVLEKNGISFSVRSHTESLWRIEITKGPSFRKAFLLWIYGNVPMEIMLERKYELAMKLIDS